MQVLNPPERSGEGTTTADIGNLAETGLADEAADLFRLLGDPTRVMILLTLAEVDEMCVHEIAATIGAGETKVSQALRLLRTAGVVRNRREGRHIHYRLDDDHVRTLLQVTRDHLAHR